MIGRRHGNKPPSGPSAEGPVEGSHGQLRSVDGQEWPVRVSEREGDVLMLVLLEKDGEINPTDTLMLEYTSRSGVARFVGEAVLEEHDLVRFRVHDSPEVEQRRQFFRVQAPKPVVLAVAGTGTIRNAYSVDLSGGGMLLSGPETLRLDDHIRFRLHLEDDAPPIKGRARVVRLADDGQRALVFEEISKTDRDRLIHFIFECEREARAKTRGLTP